MTEKTTNEKVIVRNIIIIPILVLIIFTFLAYIIIMFVIVPENEEYWNEKLTEQYIETEKYYLKHTTEQIYVMLKEDRIAQRLNLMKDLKQQNSILTAASKAGVEYKLEKDSGFLFATMTKEFFEKTFADLDFDARVKGKVGYISWIGDNGEDYFGYFNYCDTNIYIVYIDKKKILEKNRENVISKIMKLEFEKENYVFVLGHDEKIYGHHLEKLIDKDNLKELDPIRYQNLKEIVEFGKKNGSGFIEYKTGSKRNPDYLEDKISYIISDEEWEITIGFGLTIRDINERIQQQQEIKEQLLKEVLFRILNMIFLYSIVHIIIMFFYGKKIAKSFLDYKDLILIEKERTNQLFHKQNGYLAKKEKTLNSLVPTVYLDKNFNIKNCTKKFSKIFEREEDEIKGNSFFDLISQDNVEIFEDFIENADKVELTLTDSLFRTFSDRDIWLSVYVRKERIETAPINGNYDYVIVCEEANEKVSLVKKYKEEHEKTLIQEQIILQQSKMAAIGTTVDSIAHQWKQPLAVVSGEIGNLIMNVRKNKNNDGTVKLSVLQENIEKIDKTISLLSETVETFNTFYDSTDLTVEVDIAKLVKDTFKIMIPSTSANIYEIEYDIEENVYAYGSRGLYQQVLLTLIHNAIEAFRDNNVKDRKFFVTVKKRDNLSICSIEDNAGGIKEDVIPHIFDLNFSTKKKDKQGNSGLGLYLANIVIKDKFENGRLSVSNTNRGAIFTIETKNETNKNLNLKEGVDNV